MKRLTTLLVTFLLSVSIFAQSTAPISFLGIPVDGTKDHMISALVGKGFKHTKIEEEDVLIGEFNGRKSNIYIVTNRNKVYRVMVAYADCVDEIQIKINYNMLLSQFKKSEKYIELTENQPIPEGENILHGMWLHNKVYESTFYVKPSFTEEEKAQVQKDIEDMNETDADIYIWQKALGSMKGLIWFRIFKDNYNKYEICIFYDNLLNKANGEDL